MEKNMQLENERNLVQDHLEAGERLYWTGQEPRSRYLRGRILQMVILGVFLAVTGFVAVFMYILNPSILRGPINNMLPVLVPAGMFLAAIYFFAQSILAVIKGGPDLYAITDRRALIIERGTKINLHAYGPEVFPSVIPRRKKDGTGSLVFEREVTTNLGGGSSPTQRVVEYGFFGLASVDEVWKQLKMVAQPQRVVASNLAARPHLLESDADQSGFFAFQSSATRERTFHMRVCGNWLCAAKVAGSFSAEGISSIASSLGAGTLFTPLVARALNKQIECDNRYGAVDWLGQDFLAMDKENFRISAAEMENVEIREEYRTIDGARNTSGVLALHLRDGKKRKFYLVLGVDPCRVVELFRPMGVQLAFTPADAQAKVR